MQLTSLSRITVNLRATVSMPSVLTWDVSFLGPPPITSLCVRATDPNTPLLVPLFVDLHLSHLHLPTLRLMILGRFYSLLGRRLISELRASLGGLKSHPLN